MKVKNIAFIALALGAMVATSCKTTYTEIPSEYAFATFETECLGTELDGSQTLRSWGKGKDKADAIEQAKKNAVRDVIFKGINAGSGECSKKPLILEVNAQEKYEYYFNAFFKDGGAYKKGGYTKNFKWVVRLYEAQLSNVFTFAIYAESKIGVFPVTVDFTITYEGEYYHDDPVAKLMIPQASLIPTPDASDQLGLEVDLNSSVFRFKFATYSNIYFETITYNKIEKQDVYSWDSASLSIDSETQTSLSKTFTGYTTFDPKKDRDDNAYDELVTTSFKVVFNPDGTGTYEVKTIYKEFEKDGLAEIVLKTEEWHSEIGTFTYKLDAVKKSYTYYNSNGGKGSYYSSVVNGPTTIDGSKFKYDEQSGYWRVYDKETDTFGPFLCVSIAVPCAYYDPEGALNFIESHGNKALTVQNLETGEFENHKQFIEVYYSSICNSDGVCFVTMEMKEFLQKFSVSQRLFFDGNGFVESTGVYATENDQWLFACGYYQAK